MADTQYILPNDIGVSSLDCREAFRLLSSTERLYAHYLSRAAWYGGLAVLLQTSPEAPYIYALLSRLFRAQDPDQLRQHALAEGLTEEEYQVSSPRPTCILGVRGQGAGVQWTLCLSLD